MASLLHQHRHINNLVSKFFKVFPKGRKKKSRQSIMDTFAPHVLIVDDTFVDRLTASRVLKSCNIQVTIVEGPKQALDFLDVENDVKLILTDYCMPSMTGYDLLLEVKESPKLKHIPVVIMSSDNIPERIQKCLDAGAKEYIIKPIKVVDVPRILSYI